MSGLEAGTGAGAPKATTVEASPIKGPEGPSIGGNGPEAQNANAKVADALQGKVNTAKSPQDIDAAVRNFAGEMNGNDHLADLAATEQTGGPLSEQAANLDSSQFTEQSVTEAPTLEPSHHERNGTTPDSQQNNQPVMTVEEVPAAQVGPQVEAATPTPTADVSQDKFDLKSMLARKDAIANMDPGEVAKLQAEGNVLANRVASEQKAQTPVAENAAIPLPQAGEKLPPLTMDEARKIMAEPRVIANQPPAAEATMVLPVQSAETPAPAVESVQSQLPVEATPAQTPPVAEKPAPLSAADIRNEAANQYKAGKINEAEFQTALDNAVPVAERNAGKTPESQAQPWATEAPAATPDASEPNPLSEAKPEEVVAAAEQIKDEAADAQTADTLKSPEQIADELSLGRDKLVQKLLKENPNLDLAKPEVQAFLKLAAESPQNMDTLTKMTEQFMGAQAKESAEKLGIDPETFAKGSVDGIVKSMEDQLAALKKALGESPTAVQKADMEKKGWVMKLLKALALVIGTTLVVAGGVATKAGEAVSAVGKQ